MFRMNGALLGMAAIDIYPAEFRGRKIVVISTAHVLIRENWRGRNLVQKLGLRTFLAARLRYPLRPIYWFFDTFSYKSYLLLPRNFRTFWPRRDAADARAAGGAHRSAGHADIWPRVAAGARSRGALRAEAPARHGGAARAALPTPTPDLRILCARQSRPRRGRHAGLPVPADARRTG